MKRDVYLKSVLLIALASPTTLSASDPFADIYGESDFISIASGSQKSLSEAPAIASVITQEDIQSSNARNLEEILEKVAGIHVSVANAGYTPIYQIRGIGSDFNRQALTLINNIPITHIFNGDQGTTWSHMPLSVIERIEIIRGPGSVLYGADAYTGVINIVTKSGDTISPSASLTSGSNDTYIASLQNSFSLGQWEGSFVVEAGGTNGSDSIVKSDLQTLEDNEQGTSASNAPGPISSAKDWLEIWGNIESELWDIHFGYQGRYNVEQSAGWFGSLDNDGALKGERFYLNGTTTQSISEDITLEHTLALQGSSYGGLIYLSPEGHHIYNNGLIGGAWYKELHSRYNSVLSWELNDEHHFLFGMNTFIGKLFDIKEFRNYFSTFAPTPGNEILQFNQDSAEIFLKNVSRKNIGLYAQDEYTPTDSSTITVGARYDYYTDFGSTFNPRLAWVKQINDIVTTKFLYGKAFRAPSIFELYAINNPIRLGNPDLQPDTIETIESSILFTFSPQDRISFNIYRNKRSDIIRVVNGRYENAGGQRGLGFEMEWATDITSLWTVSGNVSISRNNEANSNIQASAVPQRQYFIDSIWRVSPEKTIGLELHYIGDRARSSDDPRQPAANSMYINLTGVYDPLSYPWALKAGITNLTDRENVEPSTFSPANRPGEYFPEYDLPQPSRSLYAEIAFQF